MKFQKWNVSILSINGMLTKLKTYPHNIWSPMKVKMFLTIGTPIAVISIKSVSLGLYCKCFQNGKSCVCKWTRPTSLPVNNTYIELEPISAPLPNISDQQSPQLIQEILKASGVDFSKFKFFKCCKAKCHTTPLATNINHNSLICLSICITFPYSLQPAVSGLANLELSLKSLHFIFGSSSVMVHNQHIWLHWTVTCKLYTYPKL